MAKFRPYQERDYKLITKHFEEDSDLLYQLPTGGGKSVIIENYTLDNYKAGETQLLLAHKRELVFQLRNRFQSQGLRVGTIIGSIEENTDAEIVIASIRTVAGDNRIQTILDRKFDRITIDEAHRVRTASYEKLLDKHFEINPDTKLLGVTATPYRLDKKPLNHYFKTLICSDDTATLQKDGYLANCKVFYTPVPNLKNEVQSSGGDYQVASLSAFMRKHQMLDFLVDSYEKEGHGGQMIVFCVDKKHAKDVRDKYISRGYTSIAHIDSDTELKEREDILARYARNEIQIITCIETLTEGIDLPDTKVIQLARPTQSLVLYLQMVGRGLRLKSDGGICIILDNAGCTQVHKMPNSPRTWTLNPDLDPSSGGAKNSIVGKRKDGTYTDDEDEMRFLELIEMTPEEYVLNMSNGIEKSEKFNIDVDNKIKAQLVDMGKFLASKVRSKGYAVNIKDMEGNWFSRDTISISKNNKVIKLHYSPSKPQKIALGSDSLWGGKTTDLDTLVDIGYLSEELLKGKTQGHLVDSFESIVELNNSKIDISALKKQSDEFKLEQRKIKLSLHLVENNVVKLNEPHYLSYWFKGSGYRWDKIHSLVFGKNKLLASNEVEFYNEVGVKIVQKTLKADVIVEKLGEDWQ